MPDSFSDGFEIVGVAVPGESAVAERDFDKRNALFDQSACQQASLAKAIAAVGVANGGGLFVEIEGPAGWTAHQFDGPLIGGGVADGRRVGMFGDEMFVERAEQFEPRVGQLLVDSLGQFEIFDLQRGVDVGIVGAVGLPAVDQQRGILRAEKAGRIGSGAESAERRDADKVGQFGTGRPELLGNQRAERRIADWPLRQIAGVDELGCPGMVAFLAGHRADDGQMFGLFGQLGQVFGDAQAGHRGGDFLEGAAVGMAGLGIEGVDLAGAAAHPQQDAGAAARRIAGRLGSQCLEPAGLRAADNA